jgi:hypothetical protein
MAWITNERALVVTVRQKHPCRVAGVQYSSSSGDVHGYADEVTNPSIEHLVQQARGLAVTEAAFSEVATCVRRLHTPDLAASR